MVSAPDTPFCLVVGVCSQSLSDAPDRSASKCWLSLLGYADEARLSHSFKGQFLLL